MKNTIILTVRIDYTHDGRVQNDLTAAEMVVRRLDEIHSIVDGVQITNVETYLDGKEI
ncbi:MAG: hypothetical protein J6X18_00655 [Bacteroidales bacterium]|nr:hypothetical protein [Bacteroidales bacterium]